MEKRQIKTVLELLDYAKDNFGEIIALEGEGFSMTYRELRSTVGGLAAAYQKQGFRGKKTDLYPEMSREWILVFLALLAAGAEIVIHEPAMKPEALMDGIFRRGKAEELMIPPAAEEDFAPAGPEDTAVIIYTSGTSGAPKGVMLSQKNLAADALLGYETIGPETFRPGEKTIPVLPLFHMFGITASILSPFCGGLTLVLIDEIRYLQKKLPEVRPRILFLVPMVVKAMLRRAALAVKSGALPPEAVREHAFGGLDVIVCGGAPLQAELIDEYQKLGIRLLNGYGITECAPVVTVSRYDGFRKGAVGNVRNLRGTEVRIIDGTIHVSGDIVMKGYWGRSGSGFREEDGKRWFDTQDTGTIDEEGNLFITGRKTNLIILDDGNNISPEELENMFEPYEVIRDVMVYEGKNAGGQVIAASVYPDPEWAAARGAEEAAREVERIIAEVNEALPLYKKIRKWKIREKDFHRTGLNKIIRSGVNIDE